MGFFVEWNKNKDDRKYIKQFLTGDVFEKELIYSNDIEELKAAYDVLNSINIDAFIETIFDIDVKSDISPKQVQQFSNYSNGAYRLPELLIFEPKGMDYVTIGERLVKATKEGAKRKYGENHSKLASCLGLVSIHKTRPITVTISSWGDFLLKFSVPQKEEIIKKVLCREIIIQKAISGAHNGSIDYRDLVCMLSKSTATRRRTNVKELVGKVLLNSSYEELFYRINWYGR